MKKIDKFILSSFLGPFVLTFLVVVFILLTQHMLKYFDDIIGKDLGWATLGTLLFYFSIFMTPVALPLAILLSSLITFGNLGEYFELTAIKSLGISLTRTLAPIFVVVLLLTGFAFLANNYLVPKAALEAYSLLYDIKQKKPALDLKEGAFYSGIPDISIKVNDRLPDGKSLMGVLIYDHRGIAGNKKVIMADSGKMYTIMNNQYLKLELFNGFEYAEGGNAEKGLSNGQDQDLRKTQFKKMQVVFDLSSFNMNNTDKKFFQGNRIMRNVNELEFDMDSLSQQILGHELEIYNTQNQLFNYHLKKDTLRLPKALGVFKVKKDSLQKAKFTNGSQTVNPEKPFYTPKNFIVSVKTKSFSDSLFRAPAAAIEATSALSRARLVKSQLLNFNSQIKEIDSQFKIHQTQWNKIFSNSLACIVMFLIGAPLGAIIKRGGLGIPVLISILFFIVFYVLGILGEKWGNRGVMPVSAGVWMADFILLGIGFIFLRQARQDVRLFEADFYLVIWDKIKIWLEKKKLMKVNAENGL
jgi:lipopolysaccharide export system permease protein